LGAEYAIFAKTQNGTEQMNTPSTARLTGAVKRESGK
jgi:hypothetical protein